MKLHLHLITALLIFVLILVGGAYTYHHVEGWSILDSTYFTVITATTIGYGDLTPQTTTGKIFTMFFAFFGVATVLYFISAIGSYIFKENINKRVDQLKHHIQKQEELKNKKTNKKLKRK